MDRRQWILGSGGILAGAMLGRALRPGVAEAACRVDRPLGAQLFTVRGPLAEDPASTFAALADSGIRDVELFGLSAEPSVLGMAPEALRELVDRSGLGMTFSHFNAGADGLDVPAVARNARALGLTTVILASGPGLNSGRGTGWPDRATLDGVVDLLNRLGREFADEGFTFGYHNHQVEFLPVDGVVPYDYLTERTDPKLVNLELDVGWLAVAGVDPVAMIRRHSGRVIGCHLKDFVGTGPLPADERAGAARLLVPPGEGKIDFAGVLTAMDAADVRHGFIEIDISDEPLAAVGRGARYLETLRDC